MFQGSSFGGYGQWASAVLSFFFELLFKDPLFRKDRKRGPTAMASAVPVPSTPVVVTPVTLSLDTLNSDAILTQQFYLIDVETALDYSLASHLPVEIAIVAFTLSKGVTSEFHKFVDPGAIPPPHIAGVLGKANVNGLPVTRFELSEKNYTTLWKEICEFIGFREGSTKTLPCLFAASQSVANNSLRWLAKKIGHQDQVICSVEGANVLLEALIKRANKPNPHSQALSILNAFSRNDMKTPKCKHHVKIEGERSTELARQGFRLQCALANVRWLLAALRDCAANNRPL